MAPRKVNNRNRSKATIQRRAENAARLTHQRRSFQEQTRGELFTIRVWLTSRYLAVVRLIREIDVRIASYQLQVALFTSLRDRMTSFISLMHDMHIHENVGYPIESFPRSQLIQHYEIIRVARDDCGRYADAAAFTLASQEAEKEANVLVSQYTARVYIQLTGNFQFLGTLRDEMTHMRQEIDEEE